MDENTNPQTTEEQHSESDPCVNWDGYRSVEGCGHQQSDHEEGIFECRLCGCGSYRCDGALD